MAEIDHTSRAHALLSASGASRWLNCTPSARLEEKFAESKQSVYAAEGTLAHEFGELNIRYAVGQISAKIHGLEIKKLRANKLYTLDMEDEVAKYTDYVLELFNVVKQSCPGAILLVEEKLDFSHLVEGGFGTGDICIIADLILYVIDLKYGKGVKVDALDNAQLKLYGSGALRKFEMSYDIETVKLVIVQPRLDHIDEFEISADALIEWGESVVKPKAALAYSGAGKQCAGDWCKWCKVKPMCRALADKNMELAKYDFRDPNKLSDAEIISVYTQLDMLIDWANSVKDYILDTALNGKVWDGYKVVEGKSNRKWIDEDAVRMLLYKKQYTANEVINVKVKGIGDIEKLVGKSKFPALLGEYVVKPPGAPTLVPVTDKRPALGSVESAKIDFEGFSDAIYAATNSNTNVTDEDELNLFS